MNKTWKRRNEEAGRKEYDYRRSMADNIVNKR